MLHIFFSVLEMRGNLKKTVVIVVLTILTLALFSTLVGQSVKADTSEVNILSYTWYVAQTNSLATYTGDLVIVGELQNVGTNVIGTAFVLGNAYNATGTLLDSSEGQAYIYALAPGQKAPFSIDLTPENSITQDQSWVADATNITVQAAYVSDINTTQYSALTATGLTASMIGGAYTVSGSVHNTGSQTTGNVWVETTFYNASGTVLSFNITDYISTELAPGDSATFISTPTDNTPVLSSEITNYSVFIQNSPFVAPVTPTPSPTPTAQPTATPTPSSTAGSGLTLPGSSLLIIIIVIVVVVAVVAVVLVLFRKRTALPPPPPPPPPPT